MTRNAALFLAGFILLLFLLAGMGFLPGAIQFPFTLAFGWIGYLTGVLPTVPIHWPAVASALACLAAVLLLGHTLAKWLWRETAAGIRPPWRLRWTLATTAVILLMFTAGIGATGVAHQSAWLAKSDARIFVNRFRNQETHDRSMCANNLEQIGYALQAYTAAHAGQYPDSLTSLASDTSNRLGPSALLCPASDPDPYSSPTREEHLADRPQYTYYARGLRAPLPTRRPIASEPLSNHNLTGVNILFSDGKVEWHTPAEAQQIFNAPADPIPTEAP